jgi:hypothetical protein
MNIPFALEGICKIFLSILIVTHSCGFFFASFTIVCIPVVLLRLPADVWVSPAPQERVKPAQEGSKPRRRGQTPARNAK